MRPAEITSEWLSSIFDADVTKGAHDRIGDGLVGLNLRVALESSDPAVPSSGSASTAMR